MSYVTQHWKMLLPTAIAVCVLFVGAIVVFTADNAPSKPNRVYTMPEKSSSEEVNTGSGRTNSSLANSKPLPSGSVEAGAASRQPVEMQPATPANQVTGEGTLSGEGAPSSEEAVHVHAVTDFSKQETHLAAMESELKAMAADAADLFEDAWDNTATELRLLSLADRRARLAEIRAEVSEGEDPEEEFIDIFMNQFISAMNERGVYFE